MDQSGNRPGIRAERTRSASPAFRAARPTRSAATIPIRELPRAFIRQTIDLGGERQKVDAGLNQFAGTQTANRLVITVGKFAVTDIFDTNKYAHDPRNDFMNWALIDTGTFDYAANAWGYTYGAAAEWYQGKWTLRGGMFDLSDRAQQHELDPISASSSGSARSSGATICGASPESLRSPVSQPRPHGQLSPTRSRWPRSPAGRPISPRCGNIRAAAASASIWSSRSRRMLGVFVRAGCRQWRHRAVRIRRHRPDRRGRPVALRQALGPADDTVGFAGVVNGISEDARGVSNAGGLGILVGDGKLPHPGPEQIIETYYNYALSASTT